MAKGYLYNRNRRLSHLGNVSAEAFERGRREALVCLRDLGQSPRRIPSVRSGPNSYR